jgi:hypothetical protein
MVVSLEIMFDFLIIVFLLLAAQIPFWKPRAPSARAFSSPGRS